MKAESGSSGARSFAWLNLTQFLGALNDNAFRWLVFFFLVQQLGDVSKENVIAVSTSVFVLPFLLFSHAAGVLADRVSKRTVVVGAKVMEFVVMALGCVGLIVGNAIFLYAVIFLMSTQSALFGPSKYGIIPELIRRDRLSQANGRLVGATYLAIIIGTFVTPFVLDVVFPDGFLSMGLICVGIAVLGTVASLRISPTPAAGSTKTFSPLFLVEIWRTLCVVRRDRDLFLAVVGSAYFLFLGAFIQQNIMLYGQGVLGLDWYQSGYLFPVAALGIGVGALLAGRLSGRNIEFGIVPIGALGLAAACAVLAVGTHSLAVTRCTVFVIGLSSGLFVVPLNAFIQDRSPMAIRGEVLACSNFLSFTGVAISAVVVKVLAGWLGLTPAQSFGVVAALTLLLLAATLVVLPDFFVRFIIVLVTRFIYRIRVVGEDRVPMEGGALLVPNHVSWVDALLLSSVTQRRIRFVMAREISQWRIFSWLLRLMRVIPISASDSPRRIVASLKEARTALRDGYLVCIFAEGTITRHGNIGPFRSGLEKIASGSGCPIIPVYLGGLWGSVFSYYRGRVLASLPAAVPYPVDVLFGRPMAPESRAQDVEQAVRELSGRWFNLQKRPRRTLAHAFVRTARRRWFRQALCDTTGRRLRYGEVLTASIAISRRIARVTSGEETIGILMPASVGGALANVAVTLLGKVPVNLNFTASADAYASAIEQSGIRSVVTSRAFLDKLGAFDVGARTLVVEEMTASVTRAERLRSLVLAVCAPLRLIAAHRVPKPDDLATILFSSGSTATPKGVMLSHHNILSNVEAVCMLFRFRPGHRMCGVLPFFHSFGYTVTLWCPALCGLLVAYHPNPLDGKAVAGLVRLHRLNFLAATPTFLLAYMRRATREDFESLKAVYVGGEKLGQRLADTFESRFGIRPYEGYGTTELSPVAAFNLPDLSRGGVTWPGARSGSIGRPIPGVTMRVVDAATGDALPRGEEGILHVRGPNVMRGYLGRDDLTAEVLRGGWYDTGDVARIDEDTFVFIVDRMSRFSKIGGEMVPHAAVEEVFLSTVTAQEVCVAVTGAPDERKGEQLVVLCSEEAGEISELQRHMRESRLPNLWRPREACYFRVDRIPMLGTGKLDLRRIREMASELSKGSGDALGPSDGGTGDA